jgi:hypothetical protein
VKSVCVSMAVSLELEPLDEEVEQGEGEVEEEPASLEGEAVGEQICAYHQANTTNALGSLALRRALNAGGR